MRSLTGSCSSKLKQKTGDESAFSFPEAQLSRRSWGDFFEAVGILIIEGVRSHRDVASAHGEPSGRFQVRDSGKPIPGVEIKIADDGEILAKGRTSCGVYHNNPDATAEVLDKGWMGIHTGDIGMFDPPGASP